MKRPAVGRQPLRVGLVGAGFIAPLHVAALRSLPGVRLVGITDLDGERAETLARRLRIPAAFRSLADMASAGLDVVHVLTPPDSHAEIALAAMELGCDVLIEKPLATSVADCDRLIAAAARLERRAGVNHSLLADPELRRALIEIRAGALGEIVSADLFCSAAYPPYAGGPLPPHYRDGGYPMRDLGAHAFSVLRELLGEIREQHTEFASRGGDPNLHFDEWRCLVWCDKGTGQVQLSWNARPLQYHLVVHGTRGSMRVDFALMLRTRRRSLPLRLLTGRLRPYQGLRDLVRDFYAALCGAGPLPASLEDGREVVRWLEQAARPADEAKRARDERFAPRGTPAVVVTGATGLLGRHLVRRLLAEGERVRLLVRREPHDDLLAHPQVEIVLGDLGDPEAVDGALRGATLVYHVGAATRGAWADHQRGTVVGTSNVVASCLRHGVARLVHVSSLSVLDTADLEGTAVLTEDCPLERRPSERGLYTRAKLAAEEIVARAVRDRGLCALILRPGLIVGGGRPWLSATGALQLRSRLVVLGSGTSHLPLVHVDDVVDALLLAAHGPSAAGAVYHVVDDPRISQRQLVSAVAGARGLRPAYVPRWLATLLALGVEAAAKAAGRDAPLSRRGLRAAQAHVVFDCSRIRGDLGWAPRVGLAGVLRLAATSERRRPTAGSRVGSTFPEPASPGAHPSPDLDAATGGTAGTLGEHARSGHPTLAWPAGQ